MIFNSLDMQLLILWPAISSTLVYVSFPHSPQQITKLAQRGV